MKLIIKEIADKDGINSSVSVIQESFRTVAEEYGLTRDEHPFHPAFMDNSQLEEFITRGVKLFGLFQGQEQVGFVALEKIEETEYYMMRLSVVPQKRHGGYGTKLVEFALNYAKDNGGKKLSLAIVDRQTILKDWYQGMGFKETRTDRFEHVPVAICYMEKDIYNVHND